MKIRFHLGVHGWSRVRGQLGFLVVSSRVHPLLHSAGSWDPLGQSGCSTGLVEARLMPKGCFVDKVDDDRQVHGRVTAVSPDVAILYPPCFLIQNAVATGRETSLENLLLPAREVQYEPWGCVSGRFRRKLQIRAADRMPLASTWRRQSPWKLTTARFSVRGTNPTWRRTGRRSRAAMCERDDLIHWSSPRIYACPRRSALTASPRSTPVRKPAS